MDGHDPADYARAVERLVTEPGMLQRLAQGAVEHAQSFGWGATADGLLNVYTEAMDEAAAALSA